MSERPHIAAFLLSIPVISVDDAVKLLVWTDNRADPYIYYEYMPANDNNGAFIVVNK